MEEVDLLFIEGLALNGLVEDAKVIEEGGKARLWVRTIDGKEYVSKRDDPGSVRKSYFLVRVYSQWGKLINQPMKSGITSDR
ncbi:hypothetical protein EYM_01080 [Ignicoccus islandicus DSM 13165]|uniref:Uncharacterized protein n=1 Tax=Ignicoccus islandicus DSM 13165 TaxID=940295 RepID=A0A0U3FRR2_9CREN|nr:hypothetical protein [Ignicoccus islandicus]ALU12176.1 hypothetical protein EYM_01080 [Ignicoccus islandicus DSM 13165]